jgi:hypothetical protein
MAKEMNKTEKMRKLFANKALDVEEMENVAGGSADQVADDSRFLNVLLRGHPAQCDRYGEKKIKLDYANNDRRFAEIEAAWKVCGVEAKVKKSYANHYYIDGFEVTQSQAMNHAMKVMGKQLKKSDWYWD